MIKAARILFAAAFFGVILAQSVMAGDWEARIIASTSTGAENRLTFGQRSNATDGFDGRYDMPAFLSGDIMAYFPHPEWDTPAENFWRDIKAPDPQKTWLFYVESVLSGDTLSLTWDSSKLPENYNVFLIDNLTGDWVDMTGQSSYSYANDGPRGFTIEITEIVAPLEEAPIEFLDAPTNLDGNVLSDTEIELFWTDNSIGEAGFIIMRKDKKNKEDKDDKEGDKWEEIDSVGENTTSYIDNSVDLTNQRTYKYKVKAYNGPIESDSSNAKKFKLKKEK